MATTTTTTKKRIIHQLDTPFSTIRWPEISATDQDAILELLCNFLSPLGHHRRNHARRSKGKKARKRSNSKGAGRSEEGASASQPPPEPELSAKVDIGFNSITRGLAAAQPTDGDGGSKGDSDEVTLRSPYSMVFVARGDQSAAFNCQFPQMVAAASAKRPRHQRNAEEGEKEDEKEEKIRLVGFSNQCSARLGQSLDIARVTSVAVRSDAPGAGALWELVRKTVTTVDAPWLQPSNPTYQETKIVSRETPIGAKRIKKGREHI